jgi:CheY-like chemotaxis protein
MKMILVVDDEYVTHRIIEIVLGKKNYNVISAYNGLEAVQFLADFSVDMIITDVNMPFMDGLSLIDAVRQGERYRKLPILVLTASPDPGVHDEACDRGASAFLHQPFSSFELISIVEDCLQNVAVEP